MTDHIDELIADADKAAQQKRLENQIKELLEAMRKDAFKPQHFTTTPYCHHTNTVYS